VLRAHAYALLVEDFQPPNGQKVQSQPFLDNNNFGNSPVSSKGRRCCGAAFSCNNARGRVVGPNVESTQLIRARLGEPARSPARDIWLMTIRCHSGGDGVRGLPVVSKSMSGWRAGACSPGCAARRFHHARIPQAGAWQMA